MAKIKPMTDLGSNKLQYFPLLNATRKDLYQHQPASVSVDMHNNAEELKQTKVSGIKIITSLAQNFLKKCWMTCSAAVFIIFVIYWCYGGIIAFILFIFALSGFLFQVGDFFLYHPDQPPQSRLYVPLPSLFGLPFESIFITTADGVKLHAFFIKQDSSIIDQVPTILYFHGNAGNIGHRLPNAKGFYKNLFCNVLLLEYRGYGHSEGVQSEEGLYLDAQAGMRYLLQLPFIDKTKIIVFGRSLGGAVAIDLVSHKEFAKHVLVLIVENTFTSIPDMAKEMFHSKLLGYLPLWCFNNKYLSLAKIIHINRPSLFISGQQDAIIPPRMMKQLCHASGSSLKRFQSFKDGTHNETWQCKEYYFFILRFIDDMLLAQREMEQFPTAFEAGGEIY